jgi:hypothetical protein
LGKVLKTNKLHSGWLHLVWVDEEDLLGIEFILSGPLVPNPIGKLFATVSIALSSLGKVLKTDELHLGWFTPGLHLVLKTQAILGGCRGSLDNRVQH